MSTSNVPSIPTKQSLYGLGESAFKDLINAFDNSQLLKHIDSLFESWLKSCDDGMIYKGQHLLMYRFYAATRRSIVSEDFDDLNTMLAYSRYDKFTLSNLVDDMYKSHLTDLDASKRPFANHWEIYQFCSELKALVKKTCI
jgi:hypothetical protein